MHRPSTDSARSRLLGVVRSAAVSLLLVASTLGVVGLSACGGGGGGHHDPFEGTLEIENAFFSSDFVDEIQIDEVGGPDFFAFDVFLPPDNSFFIDLFPNTYDVTIFWGDGNVEFFTVDVFDDTLTTLTVAN